MRWIKMPALVYVLILTKQAKIRPVAKKLMNFKEVKEVHELYGQYDVIAEVEGKTMKEIEDFIQKNLRTDDDIEGTETLVASDVF